MPLPKIEHPLFSVTLPSTGKKLTIRPFTVKEEKILLNAMMADEPEAMMLALKQITGNCVVTGNFDPENLPMIDFEYLWLQLRAKSVNNVIELSLEDEEDKKVRRFQLDIDKVEFINLDKKKTNVKITDEVGIKFTFPTLKMVAEIDTASDPLAMIAACVDQIYEGDNIMSASKGDFTLDEVKEFLDQIPTTKFEEIGEFLKNVPYLQYTVSYTNEAGHEKNIEIKGLANFFRYASGT